MAETYCERDGERAFPSLVGWTKTCTSYYTVVSVNGCRSIFPTKNTSCVFWHNVASLSFAHILVKHKNEQGGRSRECESRRDTSCKKGLKTLPPL